MEEATNEDATRVLRGMLKIGQPANADDDHNDDKASSANGADQETNDGTERLKNDFESTSGNGPSADSFDSFIDQDPPRISLDPVHQLVNLTGDEQKGTVVIYGNEVHITMNENETRRLLSAGSNRVRINPVVNFDWEMKYYNGNLLSVSTKYMAYALKGKSGFVVRVLNRKTLLKALIKGFTGTIEDLSFAHYNSDVLACIDSGGDIFVWTISEDDVKISYELKLHVKQNDVDSTPSKGHRLVWCPFIDEGDTEQYGEDNVSEQILTVATGNVAEVYHVSTVTSTHGNVVDHQDVTAGAVRVGNGHTKPIVDLALAPDGSVLATASEDGCVKFWQLDFESADSPRCLHEWQPHDGRPVSRLIFCDNHLVQDDNYQTTKHASEVNRIRQNRIVGMDLKKSVLEVFDDWRELQQRVENMVYSNLDMFANYKVSNASFRLHVSENTPFASPPPLKLKAALDLSAKYLVVSDISRKVLYIFLLHEDLGQGKAHVTSVAHFMLTQPLLSFVITEAKMFKSSVRDSIDQNGEAEPPEKHEKEEEDGRENADQAEAVEDEAKPIPTIRIKLHCIHPKAMQEMTVQYHPFASVRPTTPSTVAASSMTPTETGIQDGLSDVSGLDTSSTEVDDADSKSDVSSSGRPKLIAPNAFTTSIPQAVPASSVNPRVPSEHEPTNAEEAPLAPDASSVISSITSVTSMNNTFNTSLSVEELLGKSTDTQISESACTFKTCEENTLQEEPGRAPEGFSSWTGNWSPLEIPLPDSPDPAKVPFPAFKTGARGEQGQTKAEKFSGVAHSTPIQRRSPDEEKSEDAEKTPTADNEVVSNDGVLDGVKEVVGKGVTSSEEPERDEGAQSSVSRAIDLHKAVGLISEVPGNGRLGNMQGGDETTSGAEKQVEPELPRALFSEAPRNHDSEPPRQRNKTRSNLTVTPRKQVNIAPDDSVPEKTSDANTSAALNEILSLLRSQQTEINQLRNEVQHEQRRRNQDVSDVLREEVAMLEAVISSKIETILAEHGRDQDQKFESFAREKQMGEKQRHEKLVTSLTASLSSKVEKAVKNEIKNSVSSGLQKLTGSLQDQLNTIMTQRLTAVNVVLKESIQKMVQNKSVTDAIGQAVSYTLRNHLTTTFSEFLNTTMLPGFEKACQAMYSQINTAFQNGTQQYIRSLEEYGENQKERQKEQRDPIVQQLQTLVHNFQTASEKLSTSMSGSLLEMMQTQLTSSMKRLQNALLTQLQDDLNKSLHETIQTEVRSAIVEHGVQEAMNNSMPQVHQRRAQLRIRQLIEEQDFCEAFQEALNAADLGLVVMVCQACDPATLFAQNPCPLNQPILLSLIQQLSTDLGTDTELKQRYLEEAVVALDSNDPITREHVAEILNGLCQQIKYTIEMLSKNDPSNNLQRSLKRLLMAAQSLLR